MKNKIYKISDKNNNIYVDCFIALDDNLAKQKVKNQLKQTLFLFQNTKEIKEKANLNTYFNNAKNYQLLNENNQMIFDFSELIEIKEEKK